MKARRSATRKPLAGRRVLVTRAEPANGPLCRALARLGAQVHHWPAYRIEPVLTVRGRRWAAALGRFDWLVFTSARAVEAVAGWGAPRVLGAGRRPRVAVVGAATAAAARLAGWRVACRAQGEGAGDLANALRRRGLPGRRVALPASSHARPEMATALRRLQAEVAPIVAYRLRWSRRGVAALRQACALGFDALAFTSPSGVEGLVRALGAARSRALLRATPAIAIGAATRRALARRTRRRVPVASRASIESTVAAVVRALAGRRRSTTGSTAPRTTTRRRTR